MTGQGPSARYAHALALVANRFLVAMGGNDGKDTLSDTWALDTSDKPYKWQKIENAGNPPVARYVQISSPRTRCCSCPRFLYLSGWQCDIRKSKGRVATMWVENLRAVLTVLSSLVGRLPSL